MTISFLNKTNQKYNEKDSAIDQDRAVMLRPQRPPPYMAQLALGNAGPAVLSHSSENAQQTLQMWAPFSPVMLNKDNTRFSRSAFEAEYCGLPFGNSPKYRAYLAKNLPGIHDIVSKCLNEFITYEGVDCNHAWAHPVSCKKRHFCVYCASLEQKRKASRYQELINLLSEKLPRLELVAYELTFPEELRETLAWDYPRIRKLQKMFFELIGWSPAQICAIHNWSSHDHTLTSYHVHIHGLALCLDKNLKYTRPYQDTDAWRNAWYSVLEYEFPSAQISSNVHVKYWRHKNREGKTYKRLAYMLRSPVIDVARELENHDAPYDASFLDTLLIGKHGLKTCQTFGFIADGIKNKFLSQIGLHQETRGEWKLQNEKCSRPLDECPVCAGLGEKTGYKTLSELTSHTIICLGNEH